MQTWSGNDIRYWDLAPQLFPGEASQKIIPFVGAGVSVSAREAHPAPPAPEFPPAETMMQACRVLGIQDEQACRYLEFAVRCALWMQSRAKASSPPSRQELLNQLKQSEYPPYAWELAELFSQLIPYRTLADTGVTTLQRNGLVPGPAAESEELVRMLRLLSEGTGVGSPTDPLTSISSLYEGSVRGRSELWRNLRDVFANKEKPTPTHDLIAQAAKAHLDKNPWDHYLTITTNYDWLIENAMDHYKVPYAVLRLNRKDGKIYPRFANLPAREMEEVYQRNPPAAPQNFPLTTRNKVAIVYKIHGDLHPTLTEENDGLVVTDGDYVDFISRGKNAIPNVLDFILPNKQLLFLGYSFSDWNIRSVYENISGRTGKQDYAVTYRLSRFESTYFSQRDIVVILSDLNQFTSGVLKELRGGG